jgi:FkbM family methyltransferase
MFTFLRVRADTSPLLFTYVEHPNMLPESFFEGGPEQQIAGLFKHLLLPASNYTVVDIGMNTGYFSLLAASTGARVFAFEPQPLCIRNMRATLLAENAHLRSRVCVTNVAVGNSGVLEVPDSTCFGGFRGEAATDALNDLQNILMVPLHALLPKHTHVRLVKIDTEGAEATILGDLVPLARQGTVDNIVVEVVPSWWESRGATRARGLAALTMLQEMAIRTVLLDDGTPFKFPKKTVVLPAGIKGRRTRRICAGSVNRRPQRHTVWMQLVVPISLTRVSILSFFM